MRIARLALTTAPPNPQVPDGELGQIIRHILSLK